MGELGLCSRREADKWIVNGWVKVDGKIVNTLGVRVSPQERIEIDTAVRDRQSGQMTILLHKPIGYVSGHAKDGHAGIARLCCAAGNLHRGTCTQFAGRTFSSSG
jgi:23S rRNA pseudouridine2604 synthase